MATSESVPSAFALDAIMSGLSAREGLRQFRESGGHVASGTWFKLTGQLQAMLAEREGVYNEPVNRRPVASEIKTWSTAKAKGYIQQVEVLVKDRASGEIISVPFSVTGRSLASRRSVVNKALDIYSDDNAQRYNQQILGAVYTGTYQATPIGQ
jgi:hypothetical protein